jgi:tRNA A-37 threonylcarbamoyl transferase component Bud32
MRSVVIFARSTELAEVIQQADALMALSSFSVRKDEARTRAGITKSCKFGRLFIKRSRSRSWLSGLVERLRGSRAARAVRGSRYLEAGGILHPRVLAAMELRQAGAVRASFILSEALDNADTLSRFALGSDGIKGRDVHRRKKISNAVAARVRGMHDGGIYTRDLQETNIMVEDDGAGGFRVYFIDLEDFRRQRNVSRERRLTNLVHLDRSIGRFMCRASRLDFLYSYIGGRPPRVEARKLVREVIALRDRIENRRLA